MRLLRRNSTGELSLTKDFVGDNIPEYAILSHTWGTDTEEVTFKDLIDGTGKSKAGYDKIRFCAQQAADDGLQYFWVDTCCIDKSSSAELQEAINSMFRWYQNAAICYVYLSDVSTRELKASDRFSEYAWESAFRSSRWFTRGWTLQELLAPGPDSVEFFSQEGDRLGDKRTLERQIYETTEIPITALRGTPLSQFDVDERLLWAETRQTTREEDKAYSLFGIFDIQIPLLYGEGRDKALKRLREEIDKLNDLGRTMKNQGTSFSDNEISVFQLFLDHQTEAGRMMKDLQKDYLGVIESLIPRDAPSDFGPRLSAKEKPAVDATSSVKYFPDYLNSTNVQDDFDKVAMAVPDTCKWIRYQYNYQLWLESSKPCTLHLVGKMGCGKSVLVKNLIQMMNENGTNDSQESTGLFYYFCNRVSRPAESTFTMLAAILRQILERNTQLYQHIEKLVNPQSGYRSSTTTIQTLWNYVVTLLEQSSYSTAYCFIDALDECEERSREIFLRAYRSYFESKQASHKKIKFFISSRNTTHYMGDLYSSQHYFQINVHPVFVKPDIELVVHKQLNDIAERLSLGLDRKEKVLNLLVERAEGMFQWIITALKEIDDSDDCTFEELISIIESLPTELNDLYASSLVRVIDGLDGKKIDRIRQTLLWLLLAQRPLTIAEMALVIAIQRKPELSGIPSLENRPLSIGSFITKYLAPFVEVIDSCPEPNGETKLQDTLGNPDAVIKCVHKSARDFLLEACTELAPAHGLSKLYIDPQQGHEDIARVIYRCLKADEFQVDLLDSKKTDEFGMILSQKTSRDLFESTLRHISFLGYAATYRSYHVRRCKTRGEGDIFDISVDFIMDCPSRLEFAYQLSQYISNSDRETYWPTVSALSWAAVSASMPLFERFLTRAKEIDVNEKDASGGTALAIICAASSSDDFPKDAVRIAKRLLNMGADASECDTRKMTPLHWAASNGRVQLMQLLLQQKLDLEIHNDVDSYTPLHIAVDYSQIEAIRILLTASADTEARDKDGCTPLHCATRNRNVTVFRLLLKAHASIHALDNNGVAPMLIAALAGNQVIVLDLINKGADVKARDKDGWTVLQNTAQNGYEEIVKLLLKSGANITSINKNGYIALYSAAGNGHDTIIRLLLEKGTNLSTPDNNRVTLILIIVLAGNQVIVLDLINKGANVKAYDKDR